MSSSSPPQRTLKDKVIDQLLQLQDLFHSRFLTAELLNELIATYVEAIQCFDGSQAPMRKYFLNKIQFVLSRPEIDGMLERANQQSQPIQGGEDLVSAIRETIRMTSSNVPMKGEEADMFSEKMILEAIESENKKQQKQSFSKSNTNAHKSQIPSTEQSEDSKLHDRKAKIEMQMKVMREIEENMKNLKQEVQESDQKKIMKNKRINALVEEQDKDLENRRAMRKKMKKQRKKSIDEKEIKQIQEEEPLIKKEELKEAQKQIEQAIVRMTARLTERNNGLNSGTGLLAGGTGKSTGRVKIQEARDEEDQEEEKDFFAEQPNPVKPMNLSSGMKKKSGVSEQAQTTTVKVEEGTKKEENNPQSKMVSIQVEVETDRQTGNKGRITTRNEDEEDDDNLMDDDCF